MVYPPDTLNRFIPSGGIHSYIPRIVLGRILYFVIPAKVMPCIDVCTQIWYIVHTRAACTFPSKFSIIRRRWHTALNPMKSPFCTSDVRDRSCHPVALLGQQDQQVSQSRPLLR